MGSHRARRSRTGLGILLAFLLVLVSGRSSGDASSRKPRAGARLPSVLREARLRNAPVDEPPPSSGWIVYVFSPLDSGSGSQQARVEALTRSLPRGWALLSVATEAQGVPAFLERTRATVPVLTQVPAATLAAYRVTATPRTYVLDRDWKLLDVLDGPWEGKVAKELAARFGTFGGVPPAGTAADSSLPRNLCRDRQQLPYSRGARADALGVKLQCGMEGIWMPAS